MKVSIGTLKCKWAHEIPEVSIIKDVIRIQDGENNVIEMRGERDCVELGGFQIMTKYVEEHEEKKGFALGINAKQLNLATFEVDVQSDGNLNLVGRKLKSSKEGQLRLITPDYVTAKDIRVIPVNDNKIVWIQIFYENLADYCHTEALHASEEKEDEKVGGSTQLTPLDPSYHSFEISEDNSRISPANEEEDIKTISDSYFANNNVEAAGENKNSFSTVQDEVQ